LTPRLALDERIDELADLVRQHYGLADLGDPSASTDVSHLSRFYGVLIRPSQEEVIVVGRIAVDAEASSSSGKLNEASLHLESSRMMGSGVRVLLKFIPDFKVRGAPKGQANIYLFPGAIVALKGKNGGGGWFSVSEVMTVRLTRQFFSVPVPHRPLVTSPSSLYAIRLAGRCGETRTSRHVVFHDNSLRALHIRF
jgi:DNA polymerase alpha subunit B